jgi:hypothetical protein
MAAAGRNESGGVVAVDVLVMTDIGGRIVWNGGSLTAGTLQLDPNLSATGDGLPNGWKQAYGLNPLLSSGDKGPNGDPDHDGYNNLRGYLSGTDPTKDSSALRTAGIVREDNNIRVTWTCVGGHSKSMFGTAEGRRNSAGVDGVRDGQRRPSPPKTQRIASVDHSRVGTGAIPEAKAGAKGVTGLVVLKQGLAVACKVLHLNGRVEFM